MDALIGKTLGPYQIVERIGRGGMATVYKAYQPALDRKVAIKVLPAHLAEAPGFAQRFQREARAVARLEHPNILAVYDFGRQGDLSYLVMRYVEGGTLKDLLGKRLPLERVAELVSEIADALDYAHERGVVHRDVKPSNVLLDPQGRALLTDFGVARIVEETQQITGTGVGVGTPAYMSPEQGKGKPVDGRSDVYSLGVMLYEMLTGQVPYQAETPIAVVLKHINDPLPIPRQVNPAIPEAVERVVLKALAKEPEDRHQTAGEMAKALRGAIADTEPDQPRWRANLARNAAAVPRGMSIARRRVALIGVLASVSLLGVAVTFLARYQLLAPGAGLTRTEVPHSLSLIDEERATTTPWELLAAAAPTETSATARVTDGGTHGPASTLAIVSPSPGSPTAALDGEWLEEMKRGKVLFEDTFDNNLRGWPVGETPWWIASIQDGYLLVTTAAETGGFLYPEKGQNLGNFLLEAKTQRLNADTRGSVGVVFRAKEYGSHFYVFEITSEGKSHLSYLGGTDVTGWDYSRAVNKAPAENVLAVGCQEDTIVLFVNGIRVARVKDRRSLSGKFGFWVGKAVDVRFDYLRVWELP